jgi:hypothetical protein
MAAAQLSFAWVVLIVVGLRTGPLTAREVVVIATSLGCGICRCRTIARKGVVMLRGLQEIGAGQGRYLRLRDDEARLPRSVSAAALLAASRRHKMQRNDPAVPS